MSEHISIDDLIQWVSNGIYQFEHPKRVKDIVNDPQFGRYVFVHGSGTGIPIDQVILWKEVK